MRTYTHGLVGYLLYLRGTRRQKVLAVAPFLVGMLAHGALDLLTHGRAAYNHLYPFAVDPVLSPISYTDRWFVVVEHLVLAAVLAWLIARWRSARPSGPSAPAGGPFRGTMVREADGG